MATSSDTVVLLLAPALTCSSSSSSCDGLGQGAPAGACKKLRQSLAHVE